MNEIGSPKKKTDATASQLLVGINLRAFSTKILSKYSISSLSFCMLKTWVMHTMTRLYPDTPFVTML